MQHHGDTSAGGLSVCADGILSGTPVATPQGWRLVETLLPGDSVLTFEAGAKALLQVEIHPLAADTGLWPRPLWPLHVPVWALDNRIEVMLLPEQPVLIESDMAEDLHGDPFALIRAASLHGYRGIEVCRPPEGAQVVRLGFAADQIVYAARGALLSCPEVHLDLGTDFSRQSERAARAEYPVLTDTQARALVGCLMAEDIGAALRRAGQRPNQAACI